MVGRVTRLGPLHSLGPGYALGEAKDKLTAPAQLEHNVSRPIATLQRLFVSMPLNQASEPVGAKGWGVLKSAPPRADRFLSQNLPAIFFARFFF